MKIRNIVLVTAIFVLMIRSASPDATIKPDPRWTGVETWAWQQIQMGNEVRLSGSCPNRDNPETNRTSEENLADFSLRGAFLQQILTKSPYRDVTERKPLVFHGVHIAGDVVADGGTSQSRVIVTCSTIDGTV